MDSTSPIAARIEGQPRVASGSLCKPFFGMGFRTLVENLFVGRRWLLGHDGGRDPGHRRHRERHHRPADGHGHAS